MAKLVLKIIFSLLFCFVLNTQSAWASALVTPVTALDNNYVFNVGKANQTLDELSLKLSTENINLSHLKEATHTLSQLQLQAKKCVDDTTSQLNDVKQQLKEAKASTTKLTVDQRFLENKQNELTNQLSSCRLFVLRSEEAIGAYSSTLQQEVKSELFREDPSIFKNISAAPDLIHKTKIDKEQLLHETGAHLFMPLTLSLFIVSLLIGAGLGVLFKELLKKSLQTEYSAKPSLERTLETLKWSVYQKLVLLTTTLIASIYVSIINFTNYFDPFLNLFVYGLFLYSLFAIIIDALLSPPQPAQAIIELPTTFGRILAARFKFLALLLLVALAFPHIFDHQMLPQGIKNLSKTLFITLLCLNLIVIIWPIARLPKTLYKNYHLRIFVASILSFALVATVLTEWVGYHNFAVYLLKGILITLASGFLVRVAISIVNSSLNLLNQTRTTWQQNFHNWLNLKPYQTLNEVFWLRTVFYIFIWICFILVLLKAWGLKVSNYNLLVNSLVYGFSIAGIAIAPSRILFGIIIFTALTLITRLLKAHIIRRFGETMEQGAGEAIASIVGYLGFAIALLFGLLLAGVNFAGLAIIAGALSVGIGFGLQNIVNNFLSGLILLIERPIKPGDRIIVGDTEGYVRKISIRSTHVKAINHSDVLVPNSEFITKQVTNLTFQDYNYQMNIDVSVAYGSDTRLIENILLQAALNHPEVLKTRENAPSVVFKNFGEHGLNFELTYVTKNINNRGRVRSDLNFAIDEGFRQHNIEFANARSDISITEIPPIEVNK